MKKSKSILAIAGVCSIFIVIYFLVHKNVINQSSPISAVVTPCEISGYACFGSGMTSPTSFQGGTIFDLVSTDEIANFGVVVQGTYFVTVSVKGKEKALGEVYDVYRKAAIDEIHKKYFTK